MSECHVMTIAIKITIRTYFIHNWHICTEYGCLVNILDLKFVAKVALNVALWMYATTRKLIIATNAYHSIFLTFYENFTYCMPKFVLILLSLQS